EDSVTEAENLLHPLYLTPTQAKESEESHEEVAKTNHEGEAHKEENASEHEIVNVAEKNEQEKSKNEECGGGRGGGGGIIDNIVSHFPISLPGDAAPLPDEASILIHSIVHD
ncbi:hypothetical protein CFOL_v3_17084, partial [Cephalotus follicularis]